jgi:hypothetical protein
MTTDLVAARAELSADRHRLIDELKEIDMQLADPNRIDPETGERLEGEAYWSWRYAAIRAKRHKEKELQAAKALLAQVAQEIRDGDPSPAKGRGSRLEEKVDLLLEHFGIEWGEEAER